MKTFEYYGWLVCDKDRPLYEKKIKQGEDMSQADIPRMKLIIDKFINTNSTAIDIGCHYGFFTKFLSNTFKNVYAFDFDTDVFNCFKLNMENFNCTNIVAHPFGIGEVEKQVSIFRGTQNRRKQGNLATHVDLEGSGDQIVKPLDSLDIKEVSLIMVDTEGYELNVLKGAAQTIKKYKPVLVLEFHKHNLTKKYGYSLDDLDSYLQSIGYKFLEQINTVDKVYIPEEYIL